MFNYFFKASHTSVAEQEDLFKSLTEKAIATNHNDWEFIRNPVEYGVMKKTREGLYKVIELYEHVCTSIYKEYCKQVRDGNADFEMLVAYKQYQHCIEFYEKELSTVLDMLDEYWAYVWQGHFLSQFIYGYDRESWHMWDHRTGDTDGN